MRQMSTAGWNQKSAFTSATTTIIEYGRYHNADHVLDAVLESDSASESAKSRNNLLKLIAGESNPTITLNINQHVIGNFAFFEYAEHHQHIHGIREKQEVSVLALKRLMLIMMGEPISGHGNYTCPGFDVSDEFCECPARVIRQFS
jgi:hypothetical protein